MRCARTSVRIETSTGHSGTPDVSSPRSTTQQFGRYCWHHSCSSKATQCAIKHRGKRGEGGRARPRYLSLHIVSPQLTQVMVLSPFSTQYTKQRGYLERQTSEAAASKVYMMMRYNNNALAEDDGEGDTDDDAAPRCSPLPTPLGH